VRSEHLVLRGLRDDCRKLRFQGLWSARRAVQEVDTLLCGMRSRQAKRSIGAIRSGVACGRTSSSLTSTRDWCAGPGPRGPTRRRAPQHTPLSHEEFVAAARQWVASGSQCPGT
jgi:hypothetical protein